MVLHSVLAFCLIVLIHGATSSVTPVAEYATPRSSTLFPPSPRPTLPPGRPIYTHVCNNVLPRQSEDVGNYGDINCHVFDSNEEELLSREIVVNPDDGAVTHVRTFKNKLITKVNVYNFGRLHGFVRTVTVVNRGATAEVKIVITASPKAEFRVFVEIFGEDS